MALLTKKSIYGLIAVYELYKQKESDTPTQIKDIAKTTNIPKNYLEQIFIELKKVNLISSTRGARGGYSISENKKEIAIKDIIIALDGDISSTKEQTESPLFNLFFSDCDKKLISIFDKPLSYIEEYEQVLTNQINYSI